VITEPLSATGGSITSQTDIICAGTSTGAITAQGSGGTSPYQYRIGTGAYQASGTFTALAAGSHTVTVQDANLCTFDIPVVITEPAVALSISSTATNASCEGSANGQITVSGAGGTSPYNYSIDGGTYQSSGTFSNLDVATYTVSVQDANLCTATSSITITEPEQLLVSGTATDASCPEVPDGAITLSITGGTQPYNVIWSDGILTVDRTDVTGGTYSAVVADVNGCAASLTVVVGVVGTDRCLEIPDIITPNDDGYNDTWLIKNIDLFPQADVSVFNRWGKKVFATKNLAGNPWDGRYEGKLLPTDSYHYILNLNDGSKTRSGVISIIR
jgi:gliding motility-associated-like protein